jgi:tetratricopeptide (TPR) repeat protein
MIRVCFLTAIFLTIGFQSIAYAGNQPKSEIAALQKADLLLKQGKFDQAKTIYQKVLANNPKSSSAHSGYGWALYVTGQREKAIAEQQMAIALNYRNAHAHHHLGSIYYATGEIDQAVKEFNIAISIDPKMKCNCGVLEARLKNARTNEVQPTH